MTTHFHVRNGQHFCDQSLLNFFEKHDGATRWHVGFSLSSNCLTNYNDKRLNAQSNKIEGEGFGPDHQIWSARGGFRSAFETDMLTPRGLFEIMAYWYSNGVLHVNKLFELHPDRFGEYEINCDRKNNKIIYTGPQIPKPYVKDFNWSGVPTTGYKLKMYIGGDKTAKQDMDSWQERTRIS